MNNKFYKEMIKLTSINSKFKNKIKMIKIKLFQMIIIIMINYNQNIHNDNSFNL